ncbi:MAG: hypothetical protein AB1736_08200 [Chloroflexota bacterium]
MNQPLDGAIPPRQPGERPPPGGPPAGRPAGESSGRLDRPPSDRYGPRSGAAGAAGPGAGGWQAGGARFRRTLRALSPAIGALVVTVAALVVVGGVLAEQRGLLFVSGIGGAAIGLLAARAAVSPDGVAPPALARRSVVRVAVGLAVVAVAAAGLGTWAYGRLEGGVLDPIAYLWSVFGPLIPAEAAVAAIAAAWGAGAGPVRSRA